MPIIVKDYTWTQSSSTVNIQVPISSSYHEKIDLFTTDSYLKAHFRPFLFEVFLLHDVDIKKSKCLVNENFITMDLIKREEIEWKVLEREISKQEKMQLRQMILEKSQEEAQKEAEDKRVRKSELDRFTVQQAMAIDTKQHALMDSRRDAERTKAMNDLEEWRVSTERGIKDYTTDLRGNSLGVSKGEGVKIVELPSSDDECDKKEVKPKENSLNIPVKPLYPPKHVPIKPEKTPVKSEYVEKKKKEEAKRVLPKLRESAQLEISHTPRTFPTPSRESAKQEEEEWLKNVTMARRATGFVSEDLRPEEQDPQWCKEKGDEFFRNGNFLGAISAYTHGITLSDKLPSLFSNRAATHFALGNFNKCANDCSTAIDLMKPQCEGNRRSRAKCIARRGAALARMGYLTKAIDEMKEAAKLLPDDENIKKDVFDMERAWEQDPDSD